MLSDTISFSEHQRRLQEIIFSYEKALDAGQPLDRQQLLKIHADLAEGLKSYFADLDRFQQSARLAGADRDPVVVESFGEYEEIDRGGMGVVLRSRDRELGRDWAVKVIRLEHKDNPALVRRFIKEAEICGQLQHPGIVLVHKKGQLPDGRPYFTMKLVEGKTLADLLKRRPTVVELPHFLAVFDQICQAVGYAHSQHVIHRDLKPSNIMVGIHGDVQVMDWGLAKRLNDDTPRNHSGHQPPERDESGIGPGGVGSAHDLSHIGEIIGTLPYMAPEQAQGKVNELDARCDVFSLGAILCEILTGKPPYGDGDVLAKAQRGDLADALVSLDACGADEELIYLAMHCLSSNPSYRPKNAGEVARQLRQYLDSMNGRLKKEAKAAEEKCKQAQDQVQWATARAAAAEHKLKVSRNWLKGAAAALVIAFGLLGWTGLKNRVGTSSNSALPLKVATNDREPLLAPAPPSHASASSQDEDRNDKETSVQKVPLAGLSSSLHRDRLASGGVSREVYPGFNPAPWQNYIAPLSYQASRPDFLGVTAPGIFADPFPAQPGILGNYRVTPSIGPMEYLPPSITPDISSLQNASRFSESLRSVQMLNHKSFMQLERPSSVLRPLGPRATTIKTPTTPIRPIIP